MTEIKVIGENEFRAMVLESFLKDVPDKHRKRAEEYIRSEDGQFDLGFGYLQYTGAVNDKERAERLYKGRTATEIAKSFADATAYNMYMSF